MKFYIDESGDAGTNGRGSSWLAFAAVTPDDDGADLAARISYCSTKLRGHPNGLPHFQDINRHSDKRGVVEHLAMGAWTGIVVLSDTASATRGLAVSKRQYNYALRYVVERVSQLADERDEMAEIVIDHSRQFDLAEFKSYIFERVNRTDAQGRKTIWSRLDPALITTNKPATEPMLCAPDAVAHAFFKAVEKDRKWAHYETTYANALATKLWRPPASPAWDKGLVVMPTTRQAVYVGDMPWLWEWGK